MEIIEYVGNAMESMKTTCRNEIFRCKYNKTCIGFVCLILWTAEENEDQNKWGDASSLQIDVQD